MIARPAVDGLLEQGNTGFVPEVVAEQAGRIAGQSEDNRRDQLNRIEIIGETVGRDTPMQLKRGIGAFHGNVVSHQFYDILATDMDAEWLAPVVWQEHGSAVLQSSLSRPCRTGEVWAECRLAPVPHPVLRRAG